MPTLSERPAPHGVEEPPAQRHKPRGGFRIALVGNPNTGKTTLFNRLCGARAKTSNFPGTTTAARIGRTTLAGARAIVEAEVVDLPGLYRLSLETPESSICRNVLLGEGLYRKPDAVVVVVDACNLTRNLMLVGALNMVDIAQRRGLSLDATKLSTELGCPVVPIVARRGENLHRHRFLRPLDGLPQGEQRDTAAPPGEDEVRGCPRRLIGSDG